MKVVVLSISGGARTEEVHDSSFDQLISVTREKHRSSCEFDELFVYPDYNVVGFGWPDGSERKINKTELPPPHDNDFFYGEIVLCNYNVADGEYNDFTKKDYHKFIHDIHGGFDDCDSSGDESFNTSEEDLDWTPGCKEFESHDDKLSDSIYSDDGHVSDHSYDSEYSEENFDGVDAKSWDFDEEDTDLDESVAEAEAEAKAEAEAEAEAKTDDEVKDKDKDEDESKEQTEAVKEVEM